MYAQKLITENIITQEEIESVAYRFTEYLNEELIKADTYEPEKHYYKQQWAGIEQASNAITSWDTGIDYDLLRYIGEKSVYTPDSFVSNAVNKEG